MRFTLDHVQLEASDIQTFWFKSSSPLRYQAGQFVEVHLPHKNPDDRGIRRWFTLSSSPTEPLVSITTRNFGPTASSFKKALFELKSGDSFQASEAMGDFVLPKDSERPLLFVAGGIGITPMRSMAKFLEDTKEPRDITLLYAVRDEQHLIFFDIFKQIGAKVIPIISSDNKHLAGQLIKDYSSPSSLIYLSGPEPMTEQLVDELKTLGIPEHQLVTDYFPGYADEYATAKA